MQKGPQQRNWQPKDQAGRSSGNSGRGGRAPPGRTGRAGRNPQETLPKTDKEHQKEPQRELDTNEKETKEKEDLSQQLDQKTDLAKREADGAEKPSLEELARKKENEKLRAQEIQKRKEFLKSRQENLNAEQNRPDASYFKTLESSLKKNTAFVRKLSTKIAPESEAALCKELKSLNLSRYIQEVVKEISTAPLRMGDIPTAITICSLMHKYYAEFIGGLIPALKKIFSPEKNENVSRKRSTLRFLTELYTYGLYSDYSLILSIVENVVEEFREDNNPNQNLSLVLSFVRYARRDILGIERRTKGVPSLQDNIHIKDENEGELYEGEDDVPIEGEEDIEIIDEVGRAKFNAIVKNFFRKGSLYLVKLHMKLREKERENREIENTKGELSEEIMVAYKKQREEYDKVLSNMSLFADQLQCDLPTLPEEDKTTRMVVTVGNDLFKNPSQSAKESPLWDDEGMRSFYEDLEDLSIRVHPALLGLTGGVAAGAGGKTAEGEAGVKREEEEDKKEETEEVGLRW